MKKFMNGRKVEAVPRNERRKKRVSRIEGWWKQFLGMEGGRKEFLIIEGGLRKSFQECKDLGIEVCTWWTRIARKVKSSDEEGPGNVNLLKGTVP